MTDQRLSLEVPALLHAFCVHCMLLNYLPQILHHAMKSTTCSATPICTKPDRTKNSPFVNLSVGNCFILQLRLYCAFSWPKQSAIEFCPQSWRSGIVFSLPVKSVCCPCDFKLRAIFVFWCMDRSCWRATGSSHWRGFYVKLGSMLVGTQCCIV